tara:strand:- start:40 stop:501 length:462 start_codon:yes stop_codon:yes gene_type:complete
MENQPVQKSLIIEDLDLDNLSVEELLAQREDNFIDTDDLNVFYSYPYFSRGDWDFQFRLFTEKDELVLEDVKCDDTADDSVESVLVNGETARVNIHDGIKLIQENRDLKSGEKIEISTDILKYDFDELSEDEIKEIIVNNKNIVLLELYKNFF